MSERPARGVSIRWKVVAVVVVLAVLPASVVAVLLSRTTRDAVETLEQQNQDAALAEVSAAVIQRVRGFRDDAEAVAQALALAAENPASGASGEDAVRAVLGTRPTLSAVRFEVPSAKISTVIRESGNAGAVPASTASQRQRADERGVAFDTAAGSGVIVVPVPRAPSSTGAHGYVTAAADLTTLQIELERIAARRHASISMVLADSSRRAVAAVGTAGIQRGADISGLPVWKRLPDGAPWSSEISVVGSFDDHGAPYVGAVRTIGELGWAVASWRTEGEAYATLTRLKRTAAIVAGASLTGAIIVALLFAGAITRPVLKLAQQTRLIGRRETDSLDLPVRRGDEVGELARSLADMVGDLKQSEAELARQAELRGNLSRFLSRELVDSIISGEHSLALGGQRQEITVVFADVVAFTPLAESRGAEEVVTLLNELFSMLSEIVFRHGGTVDKFIGDCIMAVWGAPVPHEDHAARALAAAEDMLRFLETSNEDWRERFGVEIRLGIGINSGEAIVGNVGSDKRMEYTVVGDVVNVAARLEAIARPNQILLGQRTHELAADGFTFRDLGRHALTGRSEQTQVFELSFE